MTASVFTMARIILRSSLTTVVGLGLFLVSIHLWGTRGVHEKYEVPLKVQAQVSERQSSPGRSNVTHVTVSVSSNSLAGDGRYAPEFLLEEGRTVWHADHPPQYPQWVEISFSEPTVISHLGIRTQVDSPEGKEHCRGPKDFVLQATRDSHADILKKRKWDDLLFVKNNEFSTGEEWKDWFFESHTAYRYYRIYITEGGDSDYLTIRQIRLDNAAGPPQTVEKASPVPAQIAPAITKSPITTVIQSSSTFPEITRRTILDPPLKIDPVRVREWYDRLQQRAGVKTKEEAMDLSLDFWEKKRRTYSL